MRRFGPTAVPGGRSEKGVGIAGGRLGELFHRDVARARVDPQLGAGDAAWNPWASDRGIHRSSSPHWMRTGNFSSPMRRHLKSGSIAFWKWFVQRHDFANADAAQS